MRRRPGPPVPGARRGVSRGRLVAVLVLWLAASIALVARMIDLQVVRAPALQRIASRQQEAVIHLAGRRGLILDRVGRPLAVNVAVDSIYAVPRAIADPTAFARRVASVLGLTPRDVLLRLRRGGPYFAWLARRVPRATAEAIRHLGLGDAVGTLQESARLYPDGPLSASVLGFTGIDGVGLAGVELQYDRDLEGRGGLETADRDAIGRELVQTVRVLRPARDGDTLVLTLDEVIQHIAERELAAAVERTHARGGVAIVMDPGTGGILAMASLPTFDPNHYEAVPPERWRNRAISDVYEPGSTFKLVLAASALSSRRVSLEDRFIDPGQIRINGFTIHDAEPTEHFPSLGLGDIVKYSSNVGAAQVATRLGKAAFYSSILRFGFGRPTGIDLPGEASGIVRPPREWRGPTLQNIAFGQGISVTPLQMLVAASAMATRGLAVTPHVVEVIRDPSGHVVATPGDRPPHPVVEPGVAQQVLAMMREVVRGGTGTKAQVPGYDVAGKTGTAQRPSPRGGYEPGSYVASFVGVVPAGDPRLAILVVVDRPQGEYFGGDVAAPVFREIARQALWYLHVPPESSSPSSATETGGLVVSAPGPRGTP